MRHVILIICFFNLSDKLKSNKNIPRGHHRSFAEIVSLNFNTIINNVMLLRVGIFVTFCITCRKKRTKV